MYLAGKCSISLLEIIERLLISGRSRGEFGHGPHPVWLLTLAPLQLRNKHEILGNILNYPPPYPNVWIRPIMWPPSRVSGSAIAGNHLV